MEDRNNNHNALRKPYKIRLNLKGRKSFIVTMPYEVIEREARRNNLSIAEFLEQYQAVAEYDSFDGVHYSFTKIEAT